MRDLDRDARRHQRVEDADRVLHRDPEDTGERGRGEHRCCGQDIDRRRIMGVLAPTRDAAAGVEPGALHRGEQVEAIRRLALDRPEERRQPLVSLPGLLGPERRRPGQRHGQPEAAALAPEAHQR